MLRRYAALAALAVTALGGAPVINSYHYGASFVDEQPAKPQSKKRAVRIGGGYFGPRSRGSQAKPKRKKNRLTISRRVRRRHRRAR